MNTGEMIAAIAVPLLVCFIGLGAAALRGIIRFAQYLARAEAAQDRVADSYEEQAKQMHMYMERTDGALHGLDKRLSRIEYELGGDTS